MITGEEGGNGDPRLSCAQGVWHPAPAPAPWQGIRVRARASGTHPPGGNKPDGPGRAGASSVGPRNAFSYLSLCLDLLPGMWPPQPPGAPECARAWVRACVCEILLVVQLTYCSRRHRPPPPRGADRLAPSGRAQPRPSACPRLSASRANSSYLDRGRGSPRAPPRTRGQCRLASPASPPARLPGLAFPGPRRPSVTRRFPPPQPPNLPPRSRLPAPEPEQSPHSPNLPRLRSMPSAARPGWAGGGQGPAGLPAAASRRGGEGAPSGEGAQPSGPCRQPGAGGGPSWEKVGGATGEAARCALLGGRPGRPPQSAPRHVLQAWGWVRSGCRRAQDPGGREEWHPLLGRPAAPSSP